jgi:uncharacterized protein (TIGR02145 family)
MDYVDSNNTTAGKKLKATSGWNSYNGASGNGTDEYGFSALPGGAGGAGVSVHDVGNGGYWWSASEERDSDFAHGRGTDYVHEYAIWLYYGKSYLLSVRCLQD